jgi:hypothetical protein
MKMNEFLVEQESKLSKEQNITQDCFNITRTREHKKPRQAKSETGKIKKKNYLFLLRNVITLFQHCCSTLRQRECVRNSHKPLLFYVVLFHFAFEEE